ncbi:MAG: ribulokinase [Formivibrio sp.]|nr:ribulokinase [Formivibrio sp.]
MPLVAGVDFGTLNVRVSIFEKHAGRLGMGSADYPLNRGHDPELATQKHEDHMAALEIAMHLALECSSVHGELIEALAIDTTGSSVVMVDENLAPLDDYYLWCDHRAWREAEEITTAAHRENIEAIRWCGGVYSSEWGLAKVLHWLRHHPSRRQQFATALEHCDMVAATLCGITTTRAITRSVCAMGHKWMWSEQWGGLPAQDFLTRVDPLFAGIREKLSGVYRTSGEHAGDLCKQWAARLGLRVGIPIAASALDAHWDAIGANIRMGDVVNVVGTSTCIMAMTDETRPIPGVSGVVPGSVHPSHVGIEAGLSAVGDLFAAIARRSGSTVQSLSVGLEKYSAGQTGLLRLCWDNGDRTVLTNPALRGMTLGWNLSHTAQDEFFAAIEGTAFHTRLILKRMEEYGTPVRRVINGGGIPRMNAVLNQVYANVLNKPVLVPCDDVTGLGAAIFAFLVSDNIASVEEGQNLLCPPFRTYEPVAEENLVYEKLYAIFHDLYFHFGAHNDKSNPWSCTLPSLRSIASEVLARGTVNSTVGSIMNEV